MRIRGAVTCRSEEGAKRWQETFQALKVLGRNANQQARTTLKASGDRPETVLQISAMNTLDQLLDTLRVRQQRRIVGLQAAAKLDAERVWRMAEALSSARGAAGEAVSINNLKQLALAMLMYCETHGSYPPAASYDADGKPLLSWRVHLLPFLGAENLYRQFRLDEPWDSPHNVKLLPNMPAVYRHPADTEPGKHYSSYYVLAGPGTVFAFKNGVGLSEIRDGTSNTILLVEAQRKVPWTKPDDIPYEPGKPLPKLGGFKKNRFAAALCDGSVHTLSYPMDERVLRVLIEKADGQRIDRDALK